MPHPRTRKRKRARTPHAARSSRPGGPKPQRWRLAGEHGGVEASSVPASELPADVLPAAPLAPQLLRAPGVPAVANISMRVSKSRSLPAMLAMLSARASPCSGAGTGAASAAGKAAKGLTFMGLHAAGVNSCAAERRPVVEGRAAEARRGGQ